MLKLKLFGMKINHHVDHRGVDPTDIVLNSTDRAAMALVRAPIIGLRSGCSVIEGLVELALLELPLVEVFARG